ncbi:MAG: PadR family transcriptional regulator, partial [Candidatus Saccharimonas sp.]
MIDKTISSDLLRGHTDTVILKFLSTGDKYGYEI